ncbi:hypothetical protein CR194_05185 [Salipaludibacillus keqinensis]|uniref:Uncharacterized protein n=1 Tax=Salipaludibacillus keqinensis TaxID=2045207 RepID=A0A323TJA3_9BACI|nr:hypothetical protein [Salipaludibacillus keqinensis]PYZ94918.1 hypothetical protein CR194_05185 [Salipaludibacillus keqinensis]
MLEDFILIEWIDSLSVLIQAITAIVIAILTFYIFKIDNSRRKEESIKYYQERDKTRLFYILEFEEHLNKLKQIQMQIKHNFLNQIPYPHDSFSINEFFNLLKESEIKTNHNNIILEEYNKFFFSNNEDKESISKLHNEDFFEPFNEITPLGIKIKKECLRLEIETLPNVEIDLLSLQSIKKKLNTFPLSSHGFEILDLTETYFVLEDLKNDLEKLHKSLQTIKIENSKSIYLK